MSLLFDDSVPTLFTGNPFEREDQLRQRPAWIAQQMAKPDSLFLPLHQLKPLMKTGDRLSLGWCTLDEVAAAKPTIFLGINGGRAHFACAIDDADGVASDDRKFIDARTVAMQMGVPGNDSGQMAIIAQARSMLDWHNRHGFCANCGAPTQMERGGYMRACSNCGAQHFPRTDPVVIMLAIKGDRCVLGRPPALPPGVYTALAGFMEAGENIEEAVRREMKEEAGLDIGRVRYVASQPWPFPSSLMIGCFAEAISEDITLDDEELEDARWFARDEVAALLAGARGAFIIPPPLAIAHQLIKQWVAVTATD